MKKEKQRLLDGVGDGELFAGPGIDDALDFFEEFMSGDGFGNFLGHDDFLPILSSDEVRRINEPEGFVTVGRGHEERERLGVVGAGEDDFLSFKLIRILLADLVEGGGGDGGDGNFGFFKKFAFFFEDGLELWVHQLS